MSESCLAVGTFYDTHTHKQIHIPDTYYDCK